MKTAAPLEKDAGGDAKAGMKKVADDGELNKSIDKFQAYVSALPVADRKPSVEVLNLLFTKRQISALWMRMSDSRTRADLTVRKAWEALCKMSTGVRLERC